MGGGLPEEAPEEVPQYVKDYVAYYKTDRGYHHRSVNSNNGWAATAGGSLMYSQDAYELLQGDNKELMIIPGANHTDLYDQMDKIPFDKLESFFKENGSGI